jgi:hypothetical protein
LDFFYSGQSLAQFGKVWQSLAMWMEAVESLGVVPGCGMVVALPLVLLHLVAVAFAFFHMADNCWKVPNG